jgi:two-component system, NarL family, sensor histidine kinase UhpB
MSSNQPETGRPGTPPAARRETWHELRVSVLYVIFASLWVVLSDQVADWVAHEEPEPIELQTFKGLNFVFTTGILLYLVMYRINTRSRRAEAISREAIERFELIAHASTDAIFDWNVKDQSIWWSEGLQNLFGYPVDDRGTHIDLWSSRIHADDRKRGHANFESVLQGKADVWMDEFRFQRHDGSWADVIARARILRDAGGVAVRLVGGISDVTQRRQAEKKLEQSHRQLRALSARLESLREEERTRIAREIHDELGQMLTGLKMDLRWIERHLGQLENHAVVNPILDKAVEAGELADATITTVQKIAGDLRPGVLDNIGLAAAVEHEAARFQERTGIPCQARVPASPPTFSPDAATGVFRILQEALTNVARHAKASAAEVELRLDGPHLILDVTDNGKGISETDLTAPKSIGLLGMKERAAMMGGELTFHRGEEGGTRVTLRAPLDTHDTKFWEMV